MNQYCAFCKKQRPSAPRPSLKRWISIYARSLSNHPASIIIEEIYSNKLHYLGTELLFCSKTCFLEYLRRELKD